ISQLEPAAAGSIAFEGSVLGGMPAYRVVELGIAHAPEGRHIFPELTVSENLDLGGYTLCDPKRIEEGRRRAFHYFPRLAERRDQAGGTLSGGEQQMLAVARALMSFPKLLMLDEPSLGLAPMIIDDIFDIIRKINREEGVTVFLVEQNANEALLHADRAYILEHGEINLSGDAETLRHDPRVIEAYLGI
ncbi:MAG: ABC transporter ATP-binding protein, partial [Planctomycetota bacterium]